MKKIILSITVLGLLGILYYSYNKYSAQENKIISKNISSINNFNSVYKYLSKNFKGKYPIPSGNLILLDKTYQLIHLSDRNIPLNKIKNLAIIQGTTCDILKNNKKFQKINYDSRFTIKDKKTGKILFKKCFSYSVTKDGKKFQLGTIIENKDGKYTALLKGNSKKNIIKSYDSDILVKSDSDVFLPYSPNSLSPIFQVSKLGNSNLVLKVYDKLNDESKIVQIKNGNNVLLTGDVNGKYDISLEGIVKNNTVVKFISTEGSIIYIKGDEKTGKVNFSLKDYKIGGKKLDYFTETGRFIASIVKLSSDKDMTVNKNGVTLVIRGTKFTISADNDSFDTFLSLGHIIQKLGTQNIDITLENAFSLLKNNKIVQNLEKIRQLAGFTVYSDITYNPKYKYVISNNPGMTSILSGVSDIKRFSIKYENGQKIGLVKIKLTKSLKDILKINKGKFGLNGFKFDGKGSDMVYSNIVNTICKSQNYNNGLDISKVHYLLSNGTNLLKFKLNSSIKEKLGNMGNYVVLTSRKYDKRANTSRLGFNSKTKSIDTIGLHSLKLRGYDTVIFACDEN